MIVSLRKHAKNAFEAHDQSHVVSLKKKTEAREPAVRTSEESSRIDPIESTSAASQATQRRRRTQVPGFIALIGTILLVTIAIGIFVSYRASRISTVGSGNPSFTTQDSLDALVAHVGTLILLPQGEVPTVATVTDLEALKGQAFFEHASLGDKVLMYPKAREAVLYDPREDKVIQVAPLTVSAPAQ